MLKPLLKAQYRLAALMLLPLFFASGNFAYGDGASASDETIVAAIEPETTEISKDARDNALSYPPTLKDLTGIYGDIWLKGGVGITNTPALTDGSATEDTSSDGSDDPDDDGDATDADQATADNDGLDDDQLPDVPIVVNRQVEAYIAYFQTRGKKHFEKWLSRSNTYMELITGILSSEGVPEDLFYIAFIESGLSPVAKSRARAVGIWQFIKGTAKIYGLRVDWWIDERRDPEKSTRAAARYFKNLYDIFGSWYLAAAGYNAGEGRILRAIKRSNSDDFWVITANTKISKKDRKNRKKALKKETRDYVPKYLAAMMIAKNPASYGFEAQMEATALNYDKVKVSTATDLHIVADAAGTTVEEIKRLNPELLHWFTPPNYPNYELKVPTGTALQFAENMEKVPAPKRVKFLEHKIKRGDSIGKIAKRYGVGVKPILYLNNLKNTKSIRPGTVIIVPVRAADNGKNPSTSTAVTHMNLNG
ncbi:LysM peptidoglycan-binding domain-containing protein [bacterium]|nr:MAG: LysM peptidoglycan-binding domain-containing protein [bacterium]